MDLFYPEPLVLHTTCLGYSGPIVSPSPSSFIQHTWDTVDLFYPWTLRPSYNMPGIQWTYCIPEPLVLHTTYLGYSGPILSRALSPSYNMPGIQWTYSIPGPSSFIQHAWDTVDLFYPRPFVLHTTCLGYSGPILPRTLSPSYNIPGIQWTYSIPGPFVLHTTCLGYSGPIVSPSP